MKYEQIQCGQNKPYGNFFRKWKIYTEEKEISKVKDFCFKELYEREIPESAEWYRNIRYDGKMSGDANYYFRGYYTLEKISDGYLFTVCEPFAD